MIRALALLVALTGCKREPYVHDGVSKDAVCAWSSSPEYTELGTCIERGVALHCVRDSFKRLIVCARTPPPFFGLPAAESGADAGAE